MKGKQIVELIDANTNELFSEENNKGPLAIKIARTAK
jgi:hypothetical protein